MYQYKHDNTHFTVSKFRELWFINNNCQVFNVS